MPVLGSVRTIIGNRYASFNGFVRVAVAYGLLLNDENTEIQ